MAPIAVSNFEELKLADGKRDGKPERQVEDSTVLNADDDEDDEGGGSLDDGAATGTCTPDSISGISDGDR